MVYMYFLFLMSCVICFLSKVLVFVWSIDNDVCACVNINQHADVLLQ